MSDDAPRSTHGNRQDQRRGRGAPPSWWAALQRNDLPDDPMTRDSVVDTAGWEVPSAPPGFPGTHARRGRLAWALSIGLAVLIAVSVAVAVWVATAAAGHSAASTAAVVVSVPVALLVVSLGANLAGRLRRR